MEWISVLEQAPPNKPILVWGDCDMPHVAQYDYGAHCHTEHCSELGGHSPGTDIDFKFWAPLPNPPA